MNHFTVFQRRYLPFMQKILKGALLFGKRENVQIWLSH